MCTAWNCRWCRPRESDDSIASCCCTTAIFSSTVLGGRIPSFSHSPVTFLRMRNSVLFHRFLMALSVLQA